jgi:hypothetical protein
VEATGVDFDVGSSDVAFVFGDASDLDSAAVDEPTVTIGVIFLMVLSGTLALDKSDTDEYGRPATIFFANAGPIPGRSTNSCSDAVLRSTGVLLASASDLVAFFVLV